MHSSTIIRHGRYRRGGHRRWYSGLVNRVRDSKGKPNQDYETAIEVGHRFVLTCGIAITPDIQYVIRPADVSQLDNALLPGGRVSIQF